VYIYCNIYFIILSFFYVCAVEWLSSTYLKLVSSSSCYNEFGNTESRGQEGGWPGK
jgi:hypothetical protein